jgi:NTP pyrophosphatase (non-canonical NTP hydrolase)
MNIRECAEKAHRIAVDRGWWETHRPVPELLCLVHSEVSEALEAHRNGDEPRYAEELADIVIRVMDMAEAQGIDLEREVQDKMAWNIHRPYRHGNKRC